MNKLLVATTAVAGVMLSGAVNAKEYVFTFTDTISTASTPGISVGDTFTLKLDADNGGSTDVSQTWNLADLGGFTITAGSYAATYSQVWDNPTTGNFVTDAAGMMSSVTFYGTNPNSHNTDNFGSWTGDTVFGNAEFCDYDGRCNNIAAGGFNNAAAWTVSAGVPEPSTWAMLLIGFAGLGFAGYRKATSLRITGFGT